jgi:tRNA A37 methylthiotransferase MiaB
MPDNDKYDFSMFEQAEEPKTPQQVEKPEDSQQSKEELDFSMFEDVKKKDEPISQDFSPSGEDGGTEGDPTLPGQIHFDPSVINRTAKDEEIYEEYSVRDFYGADKLDVGALVDRYNEVVSKNIPENAELRLPTEDEFDSLVGDEQAIDTMVVESDRPLAPSSSFDYILGKGASQSLLFKSLLFLMDAGNSYSDTPFKDAYNKMQYRSQDLAEYYSNYDPNMLEDATAFAFGMFLDTPLFGGAGQVGKQGFKASSVGLNTIRKRLALRGIEKGIAEKAIVNSTERLLASKGFQYGAAAISGGTALGAYGLLSDLIYQVESGKAPEDIDWGQSLKEGGKSFLIGSTLGLTSQAFGYLNYKTAGQIENVFNRRMAQAGLRTADFAVENAIFLYGSAALDPNMNMKDITWEDAYKLAIELGALKLSGALQGKVKGLEKSKNFNKNRINQEEFNISFEDIEKRYLGKEGESTSDIIKDIKINPESFTKYLDDPNIPMMTKYKMLWAVEGIMPEYVSLPTKIETKQEGDKFVIESFDEHGNKLESREVKNEKTALVLLSQLEPQVKENVLRNKIAELSTESKAIIDNEMKAEGFDESVLFTAINKNPLERNVQDQGIMDIFSQKIDKYAAKDKKVREEAEKKAEKELAAEQKPEYSIEGQKFDDRATFLEEVGKYVGKKDAPKIEIKNDQKTSDDVVDILSKKKGVKDALQQETKTVKDEGKKEEKTEVETKEKDQVEKPKEIEGIKDEDLTDLDKKKLEGRKDSDKKSDIKQADLHSEKGGTTIDAKGNDLSGTDAFAVSIYPDRKVEITGENIPADQLAKFKVKNNDILSKEGHMVGTWFDAETGKSVIDITVVKKDLNEALALGRKYDQKEVWDLAQGAGVKYGAISERINKKPVGGNISAPSRTFKESTSKRGIKKGKNSWVRQSMDKDNTNRVLLTQFSADFMKGDYPEDPRAMTYYDKLYQSRSGYDRSGDFWEVPHWIANAAKALPNSDVYVIRDIKEASKFIKDSGYKTIAFSVLDVNKETIKKLAKDNPDVKFSVGGYIDFAKEFKGIKNIEVYSSIKDLSKGLGERVVDGYDYRHFKGSKFIPRLKMSEGCKHKCAFCCVTKEVKSVSKEEIDKQVKGIKDLDAKLIYLDDKTFGQADNYKYLSDVYKQVKKDNPDFEGFIVQTTAAQMKKMTPEFIKESGIKYIELGVESFNDPILKKNKKPATEKIIQEAVDKIKESGAVFIPNIIIGLPGETANSYARTIEFLRKNIDNTSHVNAYNLALYEGTELADNLEAKIDADMNENVLAKSFHKNREVHEKFAQDIYDVGMEMLDREPYNLREGSKVEKDQYRTMEQKDEMLNEFEMIIELPEEQFKDVKNKPLKQRMAALTKLPSRGKKVKVDEAAELKRGLKKQEQAAKLGVKAAKAEAKRKVEMINEVVDNSLKQGFITPVEHRVIRNRIKSAVGGTDYQLRKALEYADKIVKNADFRAQEAKKMDEIDQIFKELKGMKVSKDKYGKVKEIFNVGKETGEFIDEYKGFTKEDLYAMDAKDITRVLDEVKAGKEVLREKAKEKIKAKEEYKANLIDRAVQAISPLKPKKGTKLTTTGIGDRRPKASTRIWDVFDTNLTSMFSRFAAKSGEPGRVGSDWLNKELYHKKIVPAERGHKKFMLETSKNTMDFLKKNYKKDGRDVLNDMRTDITEVDIVKQEGDNLVTEKMTISRGDAIKWYMLMKDPTLSARIFEPVTIGKTGRPTKGNGFTETTAQQIESFLTPQDKKAAEHLFGEYQKLRERYNKFMQEEFGINLPENEFYSNIYSEYFTDDAAISVDDMMQMKSFGTVKANNIIARVKNKNTIKNVDAFSSYFDYVDKMEWMMQFTDPIKDYRTIFKNAAVRDVIETNYGRKPLELLDFYDQVMARDFKNMNEQVVDKLTKNFANAALGLNPNITVKQLFSTVASMTEIRPDQFLNELKNMAIDGSKAVKDKDNILRELASRESITMRGDVGLGMDVFMSNYAKPNKLSNMTIINAANKLLDKASKVYGKTIEIGDKGGALIGGYAVYKTRYKDYIKKGLSKDVAKQEALKDFDRFVDATQQSMSMFNTSMSRFKMSSMGRAVSAFTSAPAQLTRLEMNMWRNVSAGITTKGQFKNKQVLQNVARIAVVRQLIPALYQFAADGWEWDSDNQRVTAVLGNLQGVLLLGKMIEGAKNKMQNSPFDANIMPILKNAEDLYNDWFDVIDMVQFPDLYDKKERDAIAKRTADHLGLFLGQPVRSVRNVVTGDFKNFFDGIKSDQESIAKEAVDKGLPLEVVLTEQYGRDFIYDEEGDLRRSTRGYIEEYIYQVNKDRYGKYADEVKKVMNLRSNDDVEKYIRRKARRMDDADFRLFMSYLSQENSYGGDKTVRFISEELAEKIKTKVLKYK